MCYTPEILQIIFRRGEGTGQPAREAHTALVEENNVENFCYGWIETVEIRVCRKDSGCPRSAGGSDKHSLTRARGEMNSEYHRDRARVTGVEMIERYFDADAREYTALEALGSTQTIEPAFCRLSERLCVVCSGDGSER